MKPADTIQLQYDLMRWWKTEAGIKYARGWFTSALVGPKDEGIYSDPNFEPDEADVREAKRLGDQLVRRESDLLYAAKTFWMSADMQRLAESAAQRMAPQPLRRTDLPSPYGFVYLERPFYVRDTRRDLCSIRAVRWGLGINAGKSMAWNPSSRTDGISLGLYSGWHDPGDANMVQLSKQYLNLDWARPPVLFFNSEPWAFGTAYDDREVDDYYGDPPEEKLELSLAARAETLRFMAAVWTLMQQTITRTHVIGPPRAFRRRLQREGLLTDAVLEGVNVVTLRKERPVLEQTEAVGETHVEWSHRWEVEGHWRNQYYPTEKVHRQIWIDPYVKGPEDKPFVPKATVHKVSR